MKKIITFTTIKRNYIRFIFILAFIGMSFSSFAATVTLINTHDGNWNNAANWTGGSGVPTASDNVVIPNTVTNLTLSISSAVTINRLTLAKLTLTVNNGASLSIIQNDTYQQAFKTSRCCT